MIEAIISGFGLLACGFVFGRIAAKTPEKEPDLVPPEAQREIDTLSAQVETLENQLEATRRETRNVAGLVKSKDAQIEALTGRLNNAIATMNRRKTKGQRRALARQREATAFAAAEADYNLLPEERIGEV